MPTATLTLVGAADPHLATVPELRAVFSPDDPVVCRLPESMHWKPLFSTWLDHVTVPVEWTEGS
jgi:hypothetical protein